MPGKTNGRHENHRTGRPPRVMPRWRWMQTPAAPPSCGLRAAGSRQGSPLPDHTQSTKQNWNHPCAPQPRVCSPRVCPGAAWGTAGVRTGAGILWQRHAGRGGVDVQLAPLAGAVPVGAEMVGKPGKGGTAGRRRAAGAGRARGCGRLGLPAVVPGPAGTPEAHILPMHACKRSPCPSGSRFGRHHRQPVAARPRPRRRPWSAPGCHTASGCVPGQP
jgi:hypothetical protein